jgi:NAD(P)-dependent dehydrogenase (short-subunit alcohol dehydrogenase family)
MSRRVALVTGGAKRIGAAIVRSLSSQGFRVVIHCNRSLADAEALAAAIRTGGGEAGIAQGDLADLECLPELYASASALFGAPDLLINNASVFLNDSADTVQRASLQANLGTNLEAPLLLSRLFAEQLPTDETGSIINIIDQRVLRPNPQYFSYTLSKSALFAATRTMAQAFAPRIRVNGVGPGPTLPNAHDGAAGFASEAGGTLLQTPVSPEEIASAVLFLVSANHVTGQMIAVDSGQHLGWRTPDILS